MNATKTLGVLSAILLAMTVTSAQDRAVMKPTATGTTDAILIANERALYDAAVKGDKATFQSLVLPEGAWATTHGFVPLSLLANGLGSFSGITKWEIVNPQVIWLEEGSAIVRYARTGTGTFEDQPIAPTAVASTVWARRDGKWLAAHHQETDVTR
jgi:hypothetical protein